MKKILRKGFGGFVGALLLAAELAVLADWIAVGFGHPLPRTLWLTGAGVLFLLLALLPFRRHRLSDSAVKILLLFLVVLLGSKGLLVYLRRSGAYTAPDAGKSALCADRRVLVTVPEPGDETVLAGGVIELYLRYGGEVSLLYTGEATLEQARTAARSHGVPEALAFVRGDRTGEEALHIFLSERQPDVVLAAAAEKGVEVPDLAALLDALKKELPDYEPLVLQSFLRALGTEAPADFYASPCIRSTQEPSRALKGYAWDRRLRLPVDTATLSHSLPVDGAYAELTAEAAERIVSGDRVFWQLGTTAANRPSFVKLQNAQGDFLYDYYIDPLGKETFSLYTVGDADQPYSVSVQGDKCSARIGLERTLTVTCPKNQRCIVTVTSGDGKYWDTVLITNPGRFSRETAQSLEREFRHFWSDIVAPSNSGQLAAHAWDRLRARLPAA